MDRSVGIDLASQNTKTAVCAIEWDDGRAVARAPVFGAPGEEVEWLVAAAEPARWVGIDAPFGWPQEAVEALAAWADGGRWPDAAKDDLRFRFTDRFVHGAIGRWPLSVSSDRIAVAAWRCARLLDGLRPAGRPLDRTGADGVFEVYPGAALSRWGFERGGYKTSGNAGAKERQRAARSALVAAIARRAPWLDLSAAAEACISSDDALDALIASLVARAAGLGLTTPPPAGAERGRIEREGWIHLPEPAALERLAASG